MVKVVISPLKDGVNIILLYSNLRPKLSQIIQLVNGMAVKLFWVLGILLDHYLSDIYEHLKDI